MERTAWDEADEATGGLTPREASLLDFESSWWRLAEPKDDQIQERFGLSAPRYYQQLHTLIDRPEALAAYPVLVKRLLRQRDARRDARSAARLGTR